MKTKRAIIIKIDQIDYPELANQLVWEMMQQIELEAEKVYSAISDGVASAVWQMITNATTMPCTDFYDTLKAGVIEAMEKAGRYAIHGEDVEKGVAKGFASAAHYYEEEIKGALKEASDK